MSEEVPPYGRARCPQCRDTYCIRVRCSAYEPVMDCPIQAGSHFHAICLQCGHEWSEGVITPVISETFPLTGSP